MNTTVLIAVIAVIAIAALAAWMYLERRRSARLRGKFGPEYERAVREEGDRRKAESRLEKVEHRVQKFRIRDLSEEERRHFAGAWRDDQARFVDDPKGAVVEADRLITEVMRTRGYPMSEFDQRAADLSADHPHVVENYRAAHAIAERHQRGLASTEDLRMAMVHYRKLFDDLVGEPVAETAVRHQHEEVRR